MNASFANCTAVKLLSKTGRPYWFRTCDIGGDIWADGAHMVSFPLGEKLSLTGREEPLELRHAILGVTHNTLDTWLLDGVNDAGLAGGRLALYESTSVPKADEGKEGIMGMEIVTYLLATCGSVAEVIEAVKGKQLLDVPVGEGKLVASTMHCMFVEPSGQCVVLEAADSGNPGALTVYTETLGMMTNSPPYPQQLENLSWYLSQSPEWCWGKDAPPELCMNGMTLRANADAPHFSMSGTFPASYASCDRFVRMAMLKHLNRNGMDFSDEEMLPLGGQLMCSVVEPHNGGLFHYTRFDEKEGPIGGHESYTQYLVMYDITEKVMYLQPYGTTGWTKTALDGCSKDKTETHPICRHPMAGVVELQK